MRRGCSGGGCSGLLFAAFGAGLLLALVCPSRLILILAAAALILLGINVAKK